MSLPAISRRRSAGRVLCGERGDRPGGGVNAVNADNRRRKSLVYS
jgi:hypothetical protein